MPKRKSTEAPSLAAPDEAGKERIKVAVIGGGCGAMAAAFELTARKHRGRYQVTVYQEGWRLGGKGASGRGPAGRIEEHGLHVWLGYYDNAFAVLRACYAELEESKAGNPFGPWRKAFVAESDIGLFSPDERNGWQRWSAHFPPTPGLPGDPFPPDELISLRRYLARSFTLLRTLVLDCSVGRDARRAAAAPADGRERLAMAIRGLLARGAFVGGAVLAEALAVLAAALDSMPAAVDGEWLSLAEKVCAGARRWLEDRLIADVSLRHVWEVVDLGLAYIVGVIRFGLLTDERGLDAIDDWECRDWLRKNGASQRALNSPFVRGLYDLALAYEDGDPKRPSLSAGQGLRATLRLFYGYRGAIFWRMRAGMGDVVFAPLYEALRRRGVEFEFFHRLTNVGLAPGGEIGAGESSYVKSLSFDVQAKVKSGGDYQPLVDVAGRPCWPSKPDFAQLASGARLACEGRDFESHWDRGRVAEKQLEVVKEFDFVVLGIGLGAVPHVCGELVARDRRWRAMCENVKTVATQAFQVWLNEDLDSLGWDGPPYIVAGYVKPFDTWCDMAHVVPEEAWPNPPATCVYFCGVLPESPEADRCDTGYPAAMAAQVKASAIAHLKTAGKAVWPGAYDSRGRFRWSLLADPAGGHAPAAAGSFDSQYWRANINPSERYVLNTPGSTRYRISPLDMTYDNLTLAGDWTECGFNTGCVEAAVMSGRLAAHALSGSPALEEITAYDHP
ncbi:MAG TPA: FAD-dependent oxidoreductase [Caulobacteraceae bacterium]|jgi:uncharacterized protein with NAD-binding domain and iron-sulfur cluster|nr:FAD-dependent oxidoreductase [Caulobacteraceae bacterium]